MKSLALFCGSSLGTKDEYALAVAQLVSTLHAKGHGVVYGGGKVGLMGVVAESAKSLGCQVVGVMPQFLIDKELACSDLTDLVIVADMHQRKKTMIELSSGFIALPGGTGTAEEFFEAWTWGQLGLHAHPCALYNVEGCYDSLIRYFEDLVTNGFMNRVFLDSLIISDCPEVICSRIDSFKGVGAKWS
ncbi:LOG family protein [Pseudomonas antarctica]|uniref:LOG family protein n=1 Tax=Pseudomonas antarctica TaxID=219572 RepID=UPI00387B97E2